MQVELSSMPLWRRLLGRSVSCVLAWFVLTLLASVVASWVHPVSMQWVCSDTGHVKVVTMDADGHAIASLHHGLECPLCLGATLPPSRQALPQLNDTVPVRRAWATHTAHSIASARAPLPARGPPTTA